MNVHICCIHNKIGINMTRSRDHAARIWNRTEEHTYLVNTKYVNINLYYTCM